MKHTHFTKRKFLEGIGKSLLQELFTAADSAESATTSTPSPELPDKDYFDAVAKLAMNPEQLPDSIQEAFYAIEEMSTVEGQDRLQSALDSEGLQLELPEDSTLGDFATRVFLKHPSLFATKHNEQRMFRLSAFEYHVSKEPEDRSETFQEPDKEQLNRLCSDLDDWFRTHNRGDQTTRISPHFIDGEYWFLIRHGNTFARTTKIERRTTDVLHYRPAKDDVVVYSPKRDEIRINAQTKGEKNLYRQVFGWRLFGDSEHFSVPRTYTLKPLLELGVDSLEVDGVNGLSKVVLRAYETSKQSRFKEVDIKKATDIFECAREQAGNLHPLAKLESLNRAVFDLYFEGSKKPRSIHITPPNVLKLSRHCDAATVHHWLQLRGFKIGKDCA
ncbi:MAG: hypothetical protein ACFHW5_11670 [Verrucomicrobiota bacterium]